MGTDTSPEWLIGVTGTTPTRTAAAEPIADLLASGRIQGDVTITGTITEDDHRTSGAGLPWAVITITDDTAAIDANVFPKTYASCTRWPGIGDHVTIIGRLNKRPDRLEIYTTALEAQA